MALLRFRGKRLRPSPKPQQQKSGDGNGDTATCCLCQGKGYVADIGDFLIPGINFDHFGVYPFTISDYGNIVPFGNVQQLVQPSLFQQPYLGNPLMLGDFSDFGNQLPADLTDSLPAALSETKIACNGFSSFRQVD